MTLPELAVAVRAIQLSREGSDEELEQFLDEQGTALSAILDSCLALATDEGHPALADKLRRAFNELTT